MFAERPTIATLELLKRTTPNGEEVWSARSIMPHLGYGDDWPSFLKVVNKAKIALEGSGLVARDHFRDMVERGSRGRLPTVQLTRRASYFVCINGDPSKQEIADAQGYFVEKTRERELSEHSSEIEERLYFHKKLRETVKSLDAIAKACGVENFRKFKSAGYMGLYARTAMELKKYKKLNPEDVPMDRAGTLELNANSFSASLTDSVLKNGQVSNEEDACSRRHSMSREVRDLMIRTLQIAPEDLPVVDSLRELSRQRKSAVVVPANSPRSSVGGDLQLVLFK